MDDTVNPLTTPQHPKVSYFPRWTQSFTALLPNCN